MGIAGSKDETGKVILGNLPPGFLDERGKQLRDELDLCLEKNMWWFSIAGLLAVVPICIKYRTERPFYTAAIICPVADMYFGTLRCAPENEAFREHYKLLQEAFNQPVGATAPWRQQRQPQQHETQPPGRWLPPEERLRQQQQQQQQWSERQWQQWQQQQLAEGWEQPAGGEQLLDDQLQQQQQQARSAGQESAHKSWWRVWR